jgi:hypothetical protein
MAETIIFLGGGVRGGQKKQIFSKIIPSPVIKIKPYNYTVSAYHKIKTDEVL